MSTEVRTALAEAVSAIDGLSCSPYFKQTTHPGSAMVRLDRLTRSENGFGFMATWQVLVLLPQDIAAAEKYLEAKAPALIEAISEHAVVRSLTPQDLILDTGSKLPCVVIEAIRESE